MIDWVTTASNFLTFAGGLWLGTRLQNSIKHQYDKKLEDLKTETRRLEQATVIAEVLAEWVARPADTRRLNQLSWTAAILLPENIVIDLAKTLVWNQDAPSAKEHIISSRRKNA